MFWAIVCLLAAGRGSHRRRVLGHPASFIFIVSFSLAQALVINTTNVDANSTGNIASCSLPWSPSQNGMRLISQSWYSSDCNTTSCKARNILKIGTALSLTYTTKYGPIGRSVEQAYTLYFDWLNRERGGVNIDGEKHWVELILMDDESDKQRVTEITNYLHDELKIVNFLGPYSSGLTGPAAEVIHAKGAVMVAPCAASTSVFKGRPRVFGTLPLTDSFLFNVFEKLHLHADTVAYVYEDLPFTRGVCRVINELAAKKGMTTPFGSLNTRQGRLSDDANQSEVDAMVKRVSTHKVDLFIGCVYDNVCKRILRSAEQQQFNPKAMAFTICVSRDNFRQTVGDAAGFVLGVAPWTKELQVTSNLTGLNVREFVALFEGRYSGSVPYQATSAFAAAATLVYGIETARTTNPEKVADVLRQIDINSVFGKISFDQNGQGLNPIKVVQVFSESSPVISPASAATAELEYPKPTFEALPCLNTDPYNIGRHGIYQNGSCLKCLPTEVAPYNKTAEYRSCQKLMCERGKRSVIFGPQNNMKAGAYCASCFFGYFSADNGHTQCDACQPGMYQDVRSQSACHFCPPGKLAPQRGAVQCQVCQSGRFSSEHGSSACEPCPFGSKCLADESGLFTGYTNINGWHMLKSSKSINTTDRGELIQCRHGKDGSACVEDGKCYVDEEGRTTMEGICCGNCRANFGRLTAAGVCKACPSFLVTMLLCGVHILFIVGFSGAVYLMVLWTDLTQPKNIGSVILKQLINYVGMITVVWGGTNLRFPVQLAWLADVLQGFTMFFGSSSPLFAAHAGNCLVARFMSPIKAHVILSLVWVPLWILFLKVLFWTYWLWKKTTGQKPPMKSRLMTVLVVNLFIVHQRNTELSLSIFNCSHFDVPRLMLDTSIECEGSEYLMWQLLGLSAFFIYSLGIPLGIFWFLWSYKKAKKLDNRKTIQVVGFLYSGFEPQCYYFETVFMLRKVLFQLVVVIPPLEASNDQADRTIRCMSLLVLAVIFLALHMTLEPYDNRAYFTLDRIEAASLWAIVWTLIVQTWIYASDYAYSFNAEQNGDLRATQRNKDIRDALGTFIVAFCHLRFICLVCFLVIRPWLISTMRWSWLSNGFVQVTKEGLRIVQCSARGKRLFTTMFQELTQLLVDGKQKLDFDDMVVSLQYICVNANYHRKVALLEDAGLAELADGETSPRHIDALDKSLYLAAAGSIRASFQKVASSAFASVSLKPYWNARAEKNHENTSADEDWVTSMEEMEAMRRFNPENVKACIGELFSIEDFHLSMVRLSRSIGKRASTLPMAGSSSDISNISSIPMSGRKSFNIVASHSVKTKREMTDEDEDEDPTTPRPPLRSQSTLLARKLTEQALEKDLNRVKRQMAKLIGKQEEAKDALKAEMVVMETKRLELVRRIKDKMKTREKWDSEFDSSSSDSEEDKTAARLQSFGSLGADTAVGELSALELLTTPSFQQSVREDEQGLGAELEEAEAELHTVYETIMDVMKDAQRCKHCDTDFDPAGSCECERNPHKRIQMRQGVNTQNLSSQEWEAELVRRQRSSLSSDISVLADMADEQELWKQQMKDGQVAAFFLETDAGEEQEEMEDEVCRLRLQCEAANDTVKAQADVLQKVRASIAMLQGELSRPERVQVTSLSELDSSKN